METNKLLFPLDIQLFAEADEHEEEEEEEALDDEDFDETEGEEEEEESEKATAEPEDDDQSTSAKTKKKQSQEENARQAKLRREKEQKEKKAREEQIRKQAYEQGKLDTITVNPYTDQPITDGYDLKIYELQTKIKNAGGDPITDLPVELAKLEREEAQKRALQESAKAEEEEHIKQDIIAFKQKYNDIDAPKLLSDPLFDKFSNGKLGKGKNSLIDVYEAFLEFKNLVAKSVDEENEQKRKDEEAKQQGKAPSPNGGKTKNSDTFVNLSKEERIKILVKEGYIKN